jgi:membrane fusion protein (multidrug efflux system)
MLLYRLLERRMVARDRRWVRWGAVVGLVACIAACKSSAPKAAPPPPDVLAQSVQQQTVPVYREWIGTTNGYNNAVIRPQVRGYILTRNYREGQVVQPNQLLFQIDPREFQAQVDQAAGQLAQAQAALGKTQLDVNRYTPLAKTGAVSQEELDNAVQANLANKAAVESARAALEQAKLNLSWTKVLSPIQGVSGVAVAQIGDLVDPTTQLTTVSQVDPIKVVFPASEQEYLRYARRHQGEQPDNKDAMELHLSDGSIYPYRGTVSVIGREVDVRTGTIIVEALFPNPNNLLRPGQYAKVRAVIDEVPNALVVPQRAVQDLQGQYQVAVIAPDDVVQWRNITVGTRIDTDWVITDGLKPGERIVVEGLQKVRDGMKVAPTPYVSPTATPIPATPATLAAG